MTSIWKRIVVGAGAALGLAFFAASCGQKSPADELLLVYSGDCQAYIEPCG